MKKIEGLNIQAEDCNSIKIHDDCSFLDSKITVKGQGNVIEISKALVYRSLIINLQGNNKHITIQESSKNINNLKIVSIRGNNQTIFIGRNLSCGGLEIQMNDGDENLAIGEDCLFSWGIKMRTSDGHSVIDLSTGKAINLPKDINVGSHVWIGEDVRVLKGVKIPNNSIVGSYSVITKPFKEENTVIAGHPGKVVKYNVDWHREMPFRYNN